MIEDRYEIRGKIGQGGVGAVYRAYDKNLNREVAIKRVLPDGETEGQEAATNALLKEATALCSINHPHIVTVFDAGTDEEGPYVVMELLSGRTLDDFVEESVLDQADFRELAVQTQEALIAAQDLDLVHRDLKPGNLMIVRLPSGKFQAKLLDFGLAKFTPAPSLQTIDQGDAVMGSIHFMAPEQFERSPLDKRTDMYSMGCLYYYSLTGQYPFDGESAPQVMASHLQHRVTPLDEVRTDLPRWLCDWIMWHMRKDASDRPASANDALDMLLLLEADPSTQIPAAAGEAPAPRRARLLTGANTQPISGPAATGPVPTSAPTPIPTAEAPVPVSPVPDHPAPPTSPVLKRTTAIVPPPRTTTASTNTRPVPTPTKSLGSRPPITAPVNRPPATGPQSTLTQPVYPLPGPAVKKGLSNTAKAVTAAALGVLVIIGGIVIFDRIQDNRRAEALNQIVAPFKTTDSPGEVPLDATAVDLLLSEAASAGSKKDRETYFQALYLGEATDNTDIDFEIAKFATKRDISDDVRNKFFKVLELRGSESALPFLIEFAKSGHPTVPQALAAARKMATPQNFGDLLSIIQDTSDGSIRQAAERVLSSAIESAPSKSPYAKKLVIAYETATNDEIKNTYLRLMGVAGGQEVTPVIKNALSKGKPATQIATVNALSNWPDRSQFETLAEFASNVTNSLLRSESFRSLIELVQNTEESDGVSDQQAWTRISDLAISDLEKTKTVEGLIRYPKPWALELAKIYAREDQPDAVIDRADRVIRRLESQLEKSGK